MLALSIVCSSPRTIAFTASFAIFRAIVRTERSSSAPSELSSNKVPVEQKATAAASPQVCNGVLTRAFPLHTAPKNSQKETPAAPQTSPQRSKSPLGTAARIKSLRKAFHFDSRSCPSIALRVFATSTDMRDFFFCLLWPDSSNSNERGSGMSGSSRRANGSPPADLIILARTYGRSSPIALPLPDQNPGIATLHISSANVFVASALLLPSLSCESAHSTAKLTQ